MNAEFRQRNIAAAWAIDGYMDQGPGGKEERQAAIF
jgi:hypothetical protein